MEQVKKRGSGASLEQLDARLSVGYCDHPKTKKLIRRLGFEGPFYHLKLILWCRLNKPHGVLDGMDVDDIELAVDWKGEPKALVEALVEVRFLDYDEPSGEYRMHDWEDHQPWAFKADERRASASLAGFIRQYGEDEGRRRFHMNQANRSPGRCDNPSGALDFGERDGRKSSAPSLAKPSLAKPIHTVADATAAGLCLPDWVPQEDLEAFMAMRAAIKKPLTVRALSRAVEKLDALRQQGHDPKRVLNQSEDRRWQDLYPLKDDAPRPVPAGAARNGADPTESAAKAWVEVDRALRAGERPGAWSDPVVGRALEAIGGWSSLRDVTERDLPFRRNEFVRAYVAQAGH